MENPQGTLVPKSNVAAFEFVDSNGFTVPFAVATHRRPNGKWRACFVWHRLHDQPVRRHLLTCFKIWARTEVQSTDLKRIQFFAVRIEDTGGLSRFKVVGAHRKFGDLFPVFLLPLAISKLVRPAAECLQLATPEKTAEAADDNA